MAQPLLKTNDMILRAEFAVSPAKRANVALFSRKAKTMEAESNTFWKLPLPLFRFFQHFKKIYNLDIFSLQKALAFFDVFLYDISMMNIE
ncbi:MAG: hypothetical protein IJW40_11225 [Clostridia bacterium]|nr:hypothetical protein [Clostridia bacterium]